VLRKKPIKSGSPEVSCKLDSLKVNRQPLSSRSDVQGLLGGALRLAPPNYLNCSGCLDVIRLLVACSRLASRLPFLFFAGYICGFHATSVQSRRRFLSQDDCQRRDAFIAREAMSLELDSLRFRARPGRVRNHQIPSDSVIRVFTGARQFQYISRFPPRSLGLLTSSSMTLRSELKRRSLEGL
jgi:predicted membrane metal-binding protein